MGSRLSPDTLLVSLLAGRDRREKAWDQLVTENRKLAARTLQQAERVQQLEDALSDLRSDSATSARDLKVAQDSGSPALQKKVQDLEAQVSSLKDERSELYKTQGQNAQRLLDITDTLKVKEDAEKKQAAESERLVALVESLTKKLDSLSQNLTQKDVTIQVLQDELSTLQLELVKTDERMKELQKENTSLLNRWLRKMNQEAEKMNEANQFYESVVETTTRAAEVAGATTPPLSGSDQLSPEKVSASPGMSVAPGTPTIAAPPGTAEMTPMKRSGSTSSASAYILGSVAGFLGAKGRSSSFSSASEAPANVRTGLSHERERVPAVIPTKTFWKAQVHEAEIHAVQLSFDSSIIATGGADKKLKLIEAATGATKSTLVGPTQSIMCVDFSLSGDTVLAASADNSVRLWTLSTGRTRHTLTGHIGKVFAARFNSDASRVVSGSHDRTVKLWDLQKGYCVRTIFSFSSCNDVCLVSEDGSSVASGQMDNTVRIWDVRSGNCVKELTGIHDGQVTSVSMSNDGVTLLSNSRDNSLRLIDLRTYSTVHRFTHDTYRSGVNWGRACLSPDSSYAAAGSVDGSVCIWSTLTGKVDKVLKGAHASTVCGVCWSSSGSGVVSADKDRTVCMWTE